MRQSHCTVVELGARYDSLDLDALNDAGSLLLTQAVSADPPRLVIDMSQTSFIGSTFIELLIRTWRRLNQRNGSMVLCGLQPFCAEILRVTRLETLWSCYPTRNEAVQAADKRFTVSGEE
jgi:anti-sigma B factor antagonist